MKSHRQNILPSIIERLVDKEPTSSIESVQYRKLNIDQLKNSIGRDLENLLNSRRRIHEVPSSYREVNNSIFKYGLQDFTSENPKSPSVRRRLKQDIEKTIARFEPRLFNVSVRLESPSATEQNLRFKITGLLTLNNETESVLFDTLFDVNRGEYFIAK